MTRPGQITAAQARGEGGWSPLLGTLLMIAFIYVSYEVGSAMDETPYTTNDEELGERLLGGTDGGSHPYYAILFPVLSVVIGVLVHFVLGRVLHHAFPYTAAMFLFGILLGCLLPVYREDSQLKASVEAWSNIDGHVLLMVFLPGLLFKDAFAIDVHLFRKAFGQCATMAFPEVLAFTTLMATVLMYIFIPNLSKGVEVEGTDWFIFAMLLGSILAATDPVAVSALLNEVGAPPRLKTHIAGESLLNDGAAIVFFNIFYKMDLYKATDGAVGENFTWGSGIAYFCKLSLGSMGLGIGFGIVLVALMWALNHRYNYEENVVQVMASVGMAYLSFYVRHEQLQMVDVFFVQEPVIPIHLAPSESNRSSSSCCKKYPTTMKQMYITSTSSMHLRAALCRNHRMTLALMLRSCRQLCMLNFMQRYRSLSSQSQTRGGGQSRVRAFCVPADKMQGAGRRH